MRNIQLSLEVAKKLYATASPELKKILEENFTQSELQRDITDIVKTWNDVSGRTPYFNASSRKAKSLSAYVKLQAIAEVLNESWEPDWNNKSQQKFYPVFVKNESGWRFNGSDYLYNNAALGFGLYFKSPRLSEYAAKQFLDIYQEYLQ